MAHKAASRERLLVLKLLQDYCTIREARDLLEKRQLKHSATNWKDLIAERIEPALDAETLDLKDLVVLIREAEEHGNQHVFLYSCDPQSASTLLEPARVKKALTQQNILHALQQPSLVDLPTYRRVVEARWEPDGSFIIKTVSTRMHSRVEDEKREGSRRIVTYHDEPYRAVDMFKLRPNGLLELRIQSYKQNSQYDSDIKALWALAGTLLPETTFTPIALLKAKNWLWTHHGELKDKVRFTGMRLRNDHDFRLIAAAPSLAADLTSDDGTVEGTAGFLRHHHAYCSESNCYFLRTEGKAVSQIHVVLAGKPHEYALTAACTRPEYEHVLSEITRYNS